jgi:hypothetical protein
MPAIFAALCQEYRRQYNLEPLVKDEAEVEETGRVRATVRQLDRHFRPEASACCWTSCLCHPDIQQFMHCAIVPTLNQIMDAIAGG